MVRILALDVAKNATGWAFLAGDMSAPSWGTYHTLDWSKKSCGREMVKWRQWLAEQITKFQITGLAVEEIFVNANPRMFDFSGTQAQMMLAAHAIEMCETAGIPVYEINIKHWRESGLGFSTKSKDAGKDRMFWKRHACAAAAKRDWYIPLDEHDAAEALWIADYTVAQLDRNYKLLTSHHRGRQVADIIHKRGLHA